MTRYLAFFVVAIGLSVSALAVPVITSVAPLADHVSGGAHVVIRGTGFLACLVCSPPYGPAVIFGGTPARSVILIDDTMIDVIAPAHLPATVPIRVEQFDGTAVTSRVFTFTGDINTGFETILVPIFSPPVHGAFGSEFRTLVLATNKIQTNGPAHLYGSPDSCVHVPPSTDLFTTPTFLNPDLSVVQLATDCSPWPARLLYVPRDQAPMVTLNARVVDVSRLDQSHGTEIPIVRSEKIRNERIVLLNVPIDSRFRNTLRIYSTMQAASIIARVTLAGKTHDVTLQPGRSIFEPSFAIFSDFPPPGDGDKSIRVTIDPPEPGFGSPTPPAVPMWAFITVTNNDTQQITTITPDQQ